MHKGIKKIILALSLFSYSSFCYAQENLDNILIKLKDPDWHVRFTTLYRLTKYSTEKDERVKDAIYELADLEQKMGQPPSGGEAYAESICELYRIIGNFKEEKAIPYLLNGACAPRLELAKIGEPAVKPAMKLKFPESILYGIIKEKNPRHPLSKQSRVMIKKSLLDSVKKECLEAICMTYKLWAIRGLGEIAMQGDKEVIPLIEKVSKEDKFFRDYSKKPNYTGPKIRYPVREEAQKILEKLKKEGKIKEK